MPSDFLPGAARISSLSLLVDNVLNTPASLAVVDLTRLADGVFPSDAIPFEPHAGDIDNSTQLAYRYLATVAELCQRYQSVTLIRVIPTYNNTAYSDLLFNSLCTGGLRSLQSEYSNLRISTLCIESQPSWSVLESQVQVLLRSSTLPSDCYLDDGGSLSSRVTVSTRLGIEPVSTSLSSGQWDLVYVFGGASPLALTCLLEVLHSQSQVYLFGRRRYDDIFSLNPVLRDVSDIREYVLSNESQYADSLHGLRERVQYLSGQVELSRTIDTLGNVCASVHYYSCDLTNAEDIHKVLASIPLSHSKPTSVIFSAGLLSDSLFVNQDIHSFSRVVDVKCAGISNVLDHTNLSDLYSIYIFGSVSGAYGNKGQVNYSAANEALSAIASRYSQLHPHVKTVVFNWGPWGEIGMANEGVNTQFIRRGIYPLSTSQGAKCFLHQANSVHLGFCQPVCGFAPWNDLEATFNSGYPPNLESIYSLRSSLWHQGSVLRRFSYYESDDKRSIDFCLPLSTTPLFVDHKLAEQYVLPFAFFVELFLHLLVQRSNGPRPLCLRSIRCLKGVQVSLATTSLSLSARTADNPTATSVHVSVHSGSSSMPNYSAELCDNLDLDPLLPLPLEHGKSIAPTGVTPEQLYSNFLFHGSTYQVIHSVICIGVDVAEVGVILSGVPNDLGSFPGDWWICPPPLVDAVAQLALIWRKYYDGLVALPSGIDRLVVLSPERLTGSLQIRLANLRPSDYELLFDFYISSPAGDTLLFGRNMTCACSSALDHLNTAWKASLSSL